MARLLTCGFETGDARAEPSPSAPLLQAGTPTTQTTVKRTGAYALRLQGGQQLRFGGMGTTSTRPYRHRAYVRFAAWPTGTRNVLGRPSGYLIQILPTGELRLTFGGTLIGTGTQLSLDTWYCVEFKSQIDGAAGADDSGELRVDGVSIASETNVARSTVNSGNFDLGSGAADATLDMYFDDVAVNDDQGADQNSWPGAGNVLIAKPKADAAVGAGWEAPQTTGADTTNLFDALDNRPPAGVTHADTDANANKYVFNIASDVTTNLDLTMQDYDEAGVPADATLSLVFAIVRTGSDSATNTAGVVDLASNPDQGAETAFGAWDATNVIAAADPTGWQTISALLVNNPTVTRATDPVVRIGKRTNTTRNTMADLVGIVIEYVEATTTPVDGSILDLVFDTRALVDGGVLDLTWDAVAEVNGAVEELIWDAVGQTNGNPQELVWDTVAQVDSGVLDLVSDLRSLVDGGALDATWDLRADVSGPVLDALWDTRAVVDGSVLDLLADLIAEVGAVTQLRWDLRVDVAADPLEVLWDQGAEVNAAPARVVWDLSAEVTAGLASIWDLRSETSSELVDLLWDLHAEVGLVLGALWDLRAETAGTLEALWDLRAETSSLELEAIWDLRVETAGPVLEAPWDLRAEVAASRTFLWNLRGDVAADSLEVLWDLQQAAGEVNAEPAQLAWDVIAQVQGQVLDYVWGLRSETTASMLSVAWDLRSEVDASRSLLWNLRAGIERSRTLAWDLRAEVGSVAVAHWDLRAEIAANVLELIWDGAGQINAAPLQTVFDVVAECQRQLTLPWDTRADVAGAQARLTWDVRVAADGAQWRLIWDLGAFAAGAQCWLAWNTWGEVEAEFRLRWAMGSTSEVAHLLTLVWRLRGPFIPFADHQPTRSDAPIVQTDAVESQPTRSDAPVIQTHVVESQPTRVKVPS